MGVGRKALLGALAQEIVAYFISAGSPVQTFTGRKA
jgi:hypothetical protein